MKRALRLAGLAVMIVATAASVYLIARSWRGQDLSAYATPAAAGGVAVALAFYVAGVMASALAWRQLLLGMGLRNSWTELCGIVSATQVGKYLPGNVAHHVGRGALSMARGIGPVPLLTTGLAEIALLTLASIAVGGVALMFSGRLGVLGGLGDPGIIGLVVLASALVLAGLAALRRLAPALVARFAPRFSGRPELTSLPGPLPIMRAFALYALVYLVFGVGIALMARLLLPGVGQDPWLLVAAFALAWIIGFATPGAPAGVGVREAVMLLLLSEAYAPADASATVLAIRVATTLGDLALLPLGWWQLRCSRRDAPVAASSDPPPEREPS